MDGNLGRDLDNDRNGDLATGKDLWMHAKQNTWVLLQSIRPISCSGAVMSSAQIGQSFSLVSSVLSGLAGCAREGEELLE